MFDSILKQLDLPAYRLKQINHAIFRELIADWSQATALPADLREYLIENVPISTIEPVRVLTGDKGDTVKVAFRPCVGAGFSRPIETGPAGRDQSEKSRPAGRAHEGREDPAPRGNMQFESVLMMHNDRNTVCVSSQIGCPVGCTFCATGKMGFVRNLNYREIIDQILCFARLLKHGNKIFDKRLDDEKLRITNYELRNNENWKLNIENSLKIVNCKFKINNVVYMGMGEPMLNIENVSRSIDILTNDNLFALGKRRITISTSGYIKPLKKFLAQYPHIGLAISLHAPKQPLREKLMPTVARENHIDDLIAVAREYSQKTKRRVSFEYILIDGVNDKLEHARELAGILKNSYDCTGLIDQTLPVASRPAPEGRNEGLINQAPTGSKNIFLFHINLIPYNPIQIPNDKCQMPNFKKPNTYRVNRFRDELIKLGIPVSIRVSMGDDIAAACGQLAGK